MHGKDPRRQYHDKVRQYSDEAGSVWEDVKYGLIFGSQDFVKGIREQFTSEGKDLKLPQYNRIVNQVSYEDILRRAPAALDFDLQAAEAKKRIPAGEKDKRDLMIYLLWKTGGLTNQEVGACFGLTYSSVSRLAGKIRERLKQEKELRDVFAVLKSQIKV